MDTFSLKTFILIIVVMLTSSALCAQQSEPAGEGPRGDTVFIFKSPRELITYDARTGNVKSAIAAQFYMSDSGPGAGFFYSHYFSPSTTAFFNFIVGGARNSDEFEQLVANQETGFWEYRVENKINRLFTVPITLGLQKFVFANTISESLRPYIMAGGGSSLIIAAPYVENRQLGAEKTDWFGAFGDADFYFRPTAFAGFGAYFGSAERSLIGVDIRYYYIPFGGDGLESIKEQPIDNFGGLYLSLSVGIFN